jgi:hypothetical protein
MDKETENERNKILTFVRKAPSPCFLISKELQLPFDRVNAHLDTLMQEGKTKTFELSLLGIKERIHYAI